MSGPECLIVVNAPVSPRVRALIEEYCDDTFSDDDIAATSEGTEVALSGSSAQEFMVAVYGPEKHSVATEIYELLCKETPYAIRASGVLDEIGRRPALAKTG